jgi:tetratricopeptide (TPR) repeat protein
LRLVAAGGGDAELVARAAELVATTEAARKPEESRRAASAREERLLAVLADLQMRQMYTGINLTNADIAAEYRRAFGAYGLDLLDPDLGPRLLALRDTPLGVQLAIAFDGWARVARSIRGAPVEEVELLTGIGFDLDTDPVRTTVRQALVEQDASALVETAEAADIADAEPATLFLLASALAELGEAEVALRVVTTGADRHPADFALSSGAGLAHFRADNPARATAYLAAALALRPDLALLHSWLGDARKRVGDLAGSRISMQMAMALAPDGRWNVFEVALDSMLLGHFDEAVHHLAEIRRRLPRDLGLDILERTCHVHLGTVDFEEHLAWSLERASVEPEALIWPVIMLTFQPPPGIGLDPARALDLIEDHAPDPGWGIFAMVESAAHAQLGDGAETWARAAFAHTQLDPGDRYGPAQILLLAAAGARIQGDEATAALLLGEARRARAELVLGREADWTRSLLTITFERFEPLAEGR